MEDEKMGRLEGLLPIMSESRMTRIARKCVKKEMKENLKNQKGRKEKGRHPKGYLPVQ